MEDVELCEGLLFQSFLAFEEALKRYEKINFVQMYRRSSRTLTAYAKRAPKRIFPNNDVVYAEMDYACIHGGKNFKSRSTGLRPNQNTFQMLCPAGFKVRLTEDAKHLVIKEWSSAHSHDTSEDSFRHLPRQRRLDESLKEDTTKLLSLKANKKLVQKHLMQTTGQVVLLKDLHNAVTKSKPKQSTDNQLMCLIEEMKRVDGSITELLVTEDGVIQAIFYQDPKMANFQSKFPEILLLDATYKLNDLRMPLYVLMVVDSNGEGQIVALWIVANEEKQTISSLMDIFKEFNNIEGIRCVMADKDMVERQVILDKLPDASLLICLFHTLRSFRREITCEKLGLKPDERLAVLELAQKMAYASSEEIYQEVFTQVKNLKLDAVTTYFETNWHNIREQWVEGLKNQHKNLLNSTNNRVENINQKLKSVITKHSDIVTFFHDLKVALDVLETERNHRALQIIQKAPIFKLTPDSPEEKYFKLVTPYAFKFIRKHLSEAENDQLTLRVETTSHSCTCGFWTSMSIPCRHIFKYRSSHLAELYEVNLVAERWQREYYLASHHIFQASVESAQIPAVQVPRVRHSEHTQPKSQQEKYRKAFQISQRLASLASESTGCLFEKRLAFLRNIEEVWRNGRDAELTPSMALDIDNTPITKKLMPQTPLVTALPLVTTVTTKAMPLVKGPSKVIEIEVMPSLNSTDSNTPFLSTASNTRSMPTGNTSCIEDTAAITSHSHDAFLKLLADAVTTLQKDQNRWQTFKLKAALTKRNSLWTRESRICQAVLEDHQEDVDVDPPPEKALQPAVFQFIQQMDMGSDKCTMDTRRRMMDLILTHLVDEGYYKLQRPLPDDMIPNPCEEIDLNCLQLPPRIPKRGRPKGAEVTVVGLPKKRQRTTRPIPFMKKQPAEKEKIMLNWFVKPTTAEKAMEGDELIGKSSLERVEKIPTMCIDENVDLNRIHKYFTDRAWKALLTLVETVRERNIWRCKVCSSPLDNLSIGCDSCLEWYHGRCVGLTKAPKKSTWVCRTCNDLV